MKNIALPLLIIIGIFYISFNIGILVTIFYIVHAIFKTPTKTLSTNDPQSPLYNWHLLDNLDEENLYVSWNEIFKSKLISLESFNLNLSRKEVSQNWRDNCEFVLSEIGKYYNLEEDIVIVYYRSPKASWRALAGYEGYVFISRKEKKQIEFITTVVS